MRVVLHILTSENNELAREVIAQQSRNSELKMRISDLTTLTPDYASVIEDIFAAESVAVW